MNVKLKLLSVSIITSSLVPDLSAQYRIANGEKVQRRNRFISA